MYSKYDDTKTNGATYCISDSDPLPSMLPGTRMHYAYYVGGDNAIHLWYWDGSSWADQTLGGNVLALTSPSSYFLVVG